MNCKMIVFTKYSAFHLFLIQHLLFFFHAWKKSETQNFSELSEFSEPLNVKFDFSEPWFFFHARKKSESQNFSELSEFFELLKVKFDFSGMFSNRVCIANRSFDSSDSTCFDRPDWAKPTLTATENLVFLGLGFLGPAGLENEAYFRNTVFPPPLQKKKTFFFRWISRRPDPAAQRLLL